LKIPHQKQEQEEQERKGIDQMDELEKIFLEALTEGLKNGIKEPEDIDSKVEDQMRKSAARVAKANKALFDAHIDAGFSANYAIQIVVAQNYKK
jgi:hypothetical protein